MKFLGCYLVGSWLPFEISFPRMKHKTNGLKLMKPRNIDLAYWGKEMFGDISSGDFSYQTRLTIKVIIHFHIESPNI